MKHSNTSDNPLLDNAPQATLGLVTRALQPEQSSPKNALQLNAQSATNWLASLGQDAGQLPVGALTPAQKISMRRKGQLATTKVVMQVAGGLLTYQGVLGPAAPPAARLEATEASLRGYSSLRTQAARGVKLTGNLRLLTMAYGWFIVQRLRDVVISTIEDPATPPLESERWRSLFTTMLLHKDDQLTAVAQGKSDAQAQRQSDAADVERLTNEANMADVATAVQNGWPLDMDSLLQAARYYHQTQEAKAATPTPVTPSAPAPAESRRSPR